MLIKTQEAGSGHIMHWDLSKAYCFKETDGGYEIHFPNDQKIQINWGSGEDVCDEVRQYLVTQYNEQGYSHWQD
jgi:hypothetical protein